ncbi:hypothetical protein EC396_01955 [Lutibacter sp. HS1-25]|uniref:hypothetical protein n=1 Tax=Lutibacter sp. HS1-25 TaxID=2485000 RepID=UPI001010F04E|nr:hypothetical protein [Lutibacter sp. HS1-25]RXP63592.1 hypothetical protein EC396_01955 [Lutibacter sp. HS1-25]
MNPTISYMAFSTNKSCKEVLYNTNLWISDFDCFEIELLFLKSLTLLNVFKSNIPNLFERLQLIIKEIEQLRAENAVLNKKVKQYNNYVDSILKKDVFKLSDDYLEKYHNLAKDVFLFTQKYKNFKLELYEFLTGIIL